jgi:hypothetical protein
MQAPLAVRGKSMISYVERYQQGEHLQVWEELVALGNQVRQEPLYADAWAVACETMRRVRHNIAFVIPRLRALGYVFIHDPQAQALSLPRQELDWIQHNPPLWTEPPLDIVAQLDALEEEIGPLPLSLRAFYQEVGGVNFAGWYEDVDGFDPLFVYPFDRQLIEGPEEGPPAYSDDWAQLSLEEEQPAPEEFYRLIIAPDSFHKRNVSGGAPYEMHLPHLAADAPLLNEPHGTTFVHYLRLCCTAAGLPELEVLSRSFAGQMRDIQKGMLSF